MMIDQEQKSADVVAVMFQSRFQLGEHDRLVAKLDKEAFGFLGKKHLVAQAWFNGEKMDEAV